LRQSWRSVILTFGQLSKRASFSGFVESGKRLNEWSPSAAVETILPRMLPVLAYPSSGACSHPGGKSREFHIG